jgi:hypothetical protein
LHFLVDEEAIQSCKSIPHQVAVAGIDRQSPTELFKMLLHLLEVFVALTTQKHGYQKTAGNSKIFS